MSPVPARISGGSTRVVRDKKVQPLAVCRIFTKIVFTTNCPHAQRSRCKGKTSHVRVIIGIPALQAVARERPGEMKIILQQE